MESDALLELINNHLAILGSDKERFEFMQRIEYCQNCGDLCKITLPCYCERCANRK